MRGFSGWLSARLADGEYENLGGYFEMADWPGDIPALELLLWLTAKSPSSRACQFFAQAVIAFTETNLPPDAEHDPVRRPAHYHGAGGLESVDVAEAFDLNRYRANVLEYVLRAGRKGDDAAETQDLEKARQWLTREINLRKTGKAAW